MDLSYIRTFLHTAEVGNFSRAAEDLEYAQSTVTSQIQALEKELEQMRMYALAFKTLKGN